MQPLIYVVFLCFDSFDFIKITGFCHWFMEYLELVEVIVKNKNGCNLELEIVYLVIKNGYGF